jgi:thioredoxin
MPGMPVLPCFNCGAKNRVTSQPDKVPVCGQCKSPLPDIQTPISVTDITFAPLVAAADVPLLVDFWAEWCPPCRMIAPTLQQLAARAGGRYLIAKVDVEESPRTAGQFRINSIPALLIFKDGQLKDQLAGVQPAAALEKRILAHA